MQQAILTLRRPRAEIVDGMLRDVTRSNSLVIPRPPIAPTAIATIALLFSAATPGASPAQRERDVLGWQDVRFGMSIDEVREIYPAAELDEALCSTRGRGILPAGRSCKQLRLPNASAAGLTWDVSMSFSVREELVVVQLSLQDRRIADPDTFLSVLMSLNESYGSRSIGIPQTSPRTWTEDCQTLSERVKRGEVTRPFDFYQLKDGQRGTIVRPSGEVEISYEERVVCPGAPEKTAKLLEKLSPTSLNLFYSRRKFTTTDGL